MSPPTSPTSRLPFLPSYPYAIYPHARGLYGPNDGALGDAQPSLPMLWPREFGGLTLPAYIGKSLPYLCCLRMYEDVCLHYHALSLEGAPPTLKGSLNPCREPRRPMSMVPLLYC
nr:hypothetical protein Itr_chr05CG10030 [Ipomoea trifida]